MTEPRQQNRNRIEVPWQFLVVASAAVIAIGFTFYFLGAPHDPMVEEGLLLANSSQSNSAPLSQDNAEVAPVVDDDGKMLWASPTQGEPISLHYLPAGVQLIVHARPAAMASHVEGEKVLAALGPWGGRVARHFQHWFPGQWNEASTLTLASSPQKENQLTHLLRIELETDWTSSTLKERLGDCQKLTHRQQDYFVAEERAYWLPTERAGEVLVVCKPDEMHAMIEAADGPALLPRDLQRLLPKTDRERIFTALFTVKFLQGSGGELIADGDQLLQKTFEWLLGDDATAAVLSLHWQQDFFIELVAISTLDVRPHHYAARLGKRMSEVATRIEDYLQAQPAETYGSKVLARLPDMLRMLKNYTRIGSEQGQAVLRAYLPATAGHNLLMAAELAIARPAATSVGDLAGTPAPNSAPAQTIEQKLATVTSLSFPKETLQQALILLAEDIGVEIELRGRDLQLEGITKNQSFQLDLRDKTAGDILVKILRQANPDRTATSPADLLQKLVYVVEQPPGGLERIVVTTRAATTSRGDKLPPVFRTKPQ